MQADNKQIDKRTSMRNQNRSAALGRPAIKLQGASTSLRSNLFYIQYFNLEERVKLTKNDVLKL